MNRNKLFRGSRLLLYFAGLIAIFRASEQALDEAGAPSEPINPSTRAEPESLNATATLLAGLGVLIILWIVVVLIYPMFSYFVRERIATKVPPAKTLEQPVPPPEPRLQANPRQDFQEFRRSEQSELTQYRWVDRSKGIVSIPITQAIQIVAQRGIPLSKAGGNEYYKPQEGTRETGFEGKVAPEPR